MQQTTDSQELKVGEILKIAKEILNGEYLLTVLLMMSFYLPQVIIRRRNILLVTGLLQKN